MMSRSGVGLIEAACGHQGKDGIVHFSEAFMVVAY